MVMANSPWIPSTVLRSATINPVRYSAKWRRCAVREDVSILGHSVLHDRRKRDNPWHERMLPHPCAQTKIGQNPIRLAYFYRLEREIAKPQLNVIIMESGLAVKRSSLSAGCGRDT